VKKVGLTYTVKRRLDCVHELFYKQIAYLKDIIRYKNNSRIITYKRRNYV